VDLKEFSFLLGAEDPEMNVIEGVLSALNLKFEYAVKNSIRVNPTNAYEAENDIDVIKTIFIECDVKYNNNKKGVLLDHHHKNDYGYHKDAKDFLDASSIGQLFKILLNHKKEKMLKIFMLKTYKLNKQDGYYYDKKWIYVLKKIAVVIPDRLVKIAAIDHCLHEAYLNMCPGVDSESLLDVRLTSLAVENNITYDEALEKFEYYKRILEKNEKNLDILDLTNINLGVGYSNDYLIIREVSLFLNIPIAVKTLNDNNCTGKLMMFSLGKDQVKDFLNKKEFKKYKVKNVFGVPNRGYAGGMLINN